TMWASLRGLPKVPSSKVPTCSQILRPSAVFGIGGLAAAMLNGGGFIANSHNCFGLAESSGLLAFAFGESSMLQRMMELFDHGMIGRKRRGGFLRICEGKVESCLHAECEIS